MTQDIVENLDTDCKMQEVYLQNQIVHEITCLHFFVSWK